MLLLYAVLIGLIVGLVSGGRLASLATTRIHLWPVALLGLAFQVALFSPPLAAVVGDLGPPLYVGSTAVVLVALMVNLRQPGFVLLATGALLNLVVVVANGGHMPASPEAVAMLTGSPVLPTSHFSNSVIAGPDTHFYYFADIFVLPRPIPLANVFSIGDVLIALGGAWFIVRTMHRPRPARPEPARKGATAHPRASHG